MSVSDNDSTVRQLARVLSEISHTLESGEDRKSRVERALALARDIIPARRSALLEVHDDVTTLYVSPEEGREERERLTVAMTALHRLVEGGDEIGRSRGTTPSLALPVMGLDQIIGVIRLEPDSEPYDARHLRLLSVIAAQLGAYLAMVRLRERDSARLKEVEAAHDFQQLLAGVVGHDLRNPLAVITMLASSLLESTTDPQQARKLERALRNAEHANRLIADLVDVTESRVTGTIRVAPQDADFREVVEKSIEDLRQAHAARTIELEVELVRSRGRFDPMRLSQIVTNLVNNALIHGGPGSAVRVRLCDGDDRVVISVHNWGPPIPDALLPMIFDPFKQGSPSARPPGARGLGLGLYIVDCLAKGHGGRVTVVSDAETGTVFRVSLPHEADTPSSRAVSTHTDRRLVMVVDDDEDVRIGVSGILEKRGYEVATAANGLDALRQLRAGLRPRLILLDYWMPVMNGAELCDHCAGDPELSAIPIVIVSSDTASAVKLAQPHGRSLLTKPVPVDKLLATLESIR